MVSLQYFEEHRCGGIIYRPDLVITAAHCMYFDGVAVWRIAVPSNSSLESASMYDVAKHRVHPNYNPATLANDAAIWKPKSPLPNPSIKIRFAMDLQDDKMLSILGWGRTFRSASFKKSRPSISEFLLEALVPVLPDKTCQRIYNDIDIESQFCAGFLEGGADGCEGDSGGPIFKGNVIYGIMSSGAGCAERGLPGAYTRIQIAKHLIDIYSDGW
ncbi:hypothetical protein DSO57_1032511 [Entomophthora muscae]|uniref:Uncharacterized protein n=1 Tax=Entomophthora muscae TaxID=34485 RepID=A0ACC2SCZ0_9FUNG|nr:hypothetical protein DSO57_1032511 [Entomophthora muscae]